MFRVILVLGFFATSAGLVWASTRSGLSDPVRETLGNLGSEVFGILVTIALVDWVLERRRKQERARALAWGILHAIGSAAWVWQGGPRHASTVELLGILAGIRDDDSIQPQTHGMILDIGLRCRSLLQREAATLKTLKGVSGAFWTLGNLDSALDLHSSARSRAIKGMLEESVVALAGVLGEPVDRMPAGLLWRRDAQPGSQGDRYRLALAGITPLPGHWRDTSPPVPESGPQERKG